MTIRVNGQVVRAVRVNGKIRHEIELIEELIAQGGGDLKTLTPDFVATGLRLGYSHEKIVAIALGREHLLPRAS